MAWLSRNVEWVFSGIGVYILSLLVGIVIFFFLLIFRKKVKASIHKVAKVFVFGCGNNTNINQDDGK